MRTIIRGAVVAAATTLAMGMGGAAFAAAPNGQLNWNTHSNSQGNCIGQESSAISQNGQFVSGQPNDYNIDQTTYPGSRADLVHADLAKSC